MSVSLGGSHSCALLDDGKVMCWGKNKYGQLGDGSDTDRSSPVEVSGLTNAQSIALGGGHSCALLTDGKVMCWGFNNHGQLGDGTTSARIFPVEVSGITTATSIAVGSEHSCAVLTDGKVLCWGSNSEDQVRGSRESGYGSADPDSTTPIEVLGIPTAVSISSGHSHSCALLTDGKVNCWGSNDYDQLGGRSEYSERISEYGTRSAYRSVVEVPRITTATAIALGQYHSCALLAEGKVMCWGSNSNGQLGENQDEQCPFGESSWYSSAYCPVEASGITTATGISLGDHHSCAVLTDGRVMCWGYNINNDYRNDNTKREYCVLGDIGFTSSWSSTPLEATAISTASGVALGGTHSCAVMADDKVMCWGYNEWGQLGDGTTTNRFLRVEVLGLTPAPPTTTVVCSGPNDSGNGTTSASQTDKFMCWGPNDWDLFGNETTATRLLRVELSGSTQAPLTTSAPESTTSITPATPANCSCPEDEALDVEEDANAATRYSVVLSVSLVLFSSALLC